MVFLFGSPVGNFHQMGDASSQLVCKFLEEDLVQKFVSFPTMPPLQYPQYVRFVYTRSNSSLVPVVVI
jgi:hypothetical protein